MTTSDRAVVVLLCVWCLGASNSAWSQSSSAADGMVTAVTPVTAVTISPARLQAGRIAFLRCAACHSVTGDATSASVKVGPDLRGVIDAEAGRVAGFGYSAPMKKAASNGLRWDAATLKRWIENPAQIAPGTSMVYANSLGAEQIDALIGYLASL